MQERMELLSLLLDLTPEELEQAITLFESERSRRPLEAVSLPRQSET